MFVWNIILNYNYGHNYNYIIINEFINKYKKYNYYDVNLWKIIIMTYVIIITLYKILWQLSQFKIIV